ncbi:putative NBD/HSP70 family sugar kinase [Lentzea atacamensis]|uniref:NBD/HSP70 family sugar kinase n=1 Tax=Lentzea atacamensis TaxID=531938 RepID=A0ABX9ECX2_9PSEU|nr:putative NBD/HSP70 family sugar kinase [Lentzea atacamensis]
MCCVTKPSQELLRSISDEHVLRSLMASRRQTRAELAVTTGLSKPTVGESVRRLVELGLVADTGERTQGGRGRGRVGSFYSLADVGVALVVMIAPGGVTAECVDAYGDVVSRSHHPIADPAEVAGVLPVAAVEAVAGRQVRLAVVSAADPVDRHTGRLVQLPDSPFLVGALDPVEVLRPFLGGPVIVDNDVNWAAQAEHVASGVADFAYLYLGEGLGCALVSDGEVRRGHSGLAGEIAHLITIGPSGVATPFIEVFGELGLRQTGSTAIDVARLLAADDEVLSVVARAIGGVVTALVTLADPAVVVVGGPWGPALLDLITTGPRAVAVAAASVREPSLTGARADALSRLRTALVEASRG